jgi:hypothetical protein
LGGLSARFSESFTSVNSVFLTPLANVVGLAVLVSSRLSEPRCNSGHRPSQRGRAPGGLWGARDRRGRTPARRRPFLARPVVMVGATLNADARLGDSGGARTHAPAARRLTMSPGESEVAEGHRSASPTPSPQEALSWGVPPAARDGWAGGPQAQVPPVLEGGLGLVMGCFLHHLRPLF